MSTGIQAFDQIEISTIDFNMPKRTNDRYIANIDNSRNSILMRGSVCKIHSINMGKNSCSIVLVLEPKLYKFLHHLHSHCIERIADHFKQWFGKNPDRPISVPDIRTLQHSFKTSLIDTEDIHIKLLEVQIPLVSGNVILPIFDAAGRSIAFRDVEEGSLISPIFCFNGIWINKNSFGSDMTLYALKIKRTPERRREESSDSDSDSEEEGPRYKHDRRNDRKRRNYSESDDSEEEDRRRYRNHRDRRNRDDSSDEDEPRREQRREEPKREEPRRERDEPRREEPKREEPREEPTREESRKESKEESKDEPKEESKEESIREVEQSRRREKEEPKREIEQSRRREESRREVEQSRRREESRREAESRRRDEASRRREEPVESSRKRETTRDVESEVVSREVVTEEPVREEPSKSVKISRVARVDKVAERPTNRYRQDKEAARGRDK